MDKIQTKLNLNNFKQHLDAIRYEIELKDGKITREDALHEYFSRRVKEEKKEPIYKMPLIGKMIYNKTAHTYGMTSEMYLLMVYLMQDLELKYLTEDRINNIIKNSKEMFESRYKDIDLYNKAK